MAGKALNVYFCGKVNGCLDGTNWRNSLLDGNLDFDYFDADTSTVPNVKVKPKLGYGITYTGPFVESWEGSSDGHAPEFLAVASAVVIEQLKAADFVFAWIDSLDCYGTLFELGYAFAKGIPVCIYYDIKAAVRMGEYGHPKLQELIATDGGGHCSPQAEHWLAQQFAEYTEYATSPQEAFKDFIKRVR